MPIYRHLNTQAILAERLDDLADLRRRYTVVAAPTVDPSPFGSALRLNGNNQYINIGDIAELNAVSAYTVVFWMNQRVLDQQDFIFDKRLDVDNNISIFTLFDGNFHFVIANGVSATVGWFDYSSVISAGTWHHVAEVFDGSKPDNAGRLAVYVDGQPITLVFDGTIPATTPDTSGYDALIGFIGSSFDGILRDFVIWPRPLTTAEIADLATHKAF